MAPTLAVDTNKWYRLRVVFVAADDRSPVLTVEGGDCELQLFAKDGVFPIKLACLPSSTYGDVVWLQPKSADFDPSKVNRAPRPTKSRA